MIILGGSGNHETRGNITAMYSDGTGKDGMNCAMSIEIW
jgi:hypothetical protein